MEQRPEQPPEGKLIADAADRLSLSIREAARRAGISYGRWRQIVMGYQNVSPGVFAQVHAPAKTLARMAAVVGVTAGQMESEGRRPDAAEFMRQDARPVRSEVSFGGTTDEDRAALRPFVQEILKAAYDRLGLLARFGPGDLPYPDEYETGDDAVGALPGDLLFPDSPADARTWDNPRFSVRQRVDLIAKGHRFSAEMDEREQGRRTGLTVPALLSVAGSASRASH